MKRDILETVVKVVVAALTIPKKPRARHLI